MNTATDTPVIEGWRTELSGWGVFYARRDPERPLTPHEVACGLVRHLVADTAAELVRLAEEQRRINDELRRPLVCPFCGRGPGDAPVIVTVDESSITAERCARGGDGGGVACEHEDVEWTYQRPLPDGARCRSCGTWWRLDLIPDAVAARLSGGIPPREGIRPPADDRRP
ncbi:hypothetical protein HS041_03310 [Planomonospora sp. ID67723]|nr:hypothetical protein [Planomonospora sp. ID67723]